MNPAWLRIGTRRSSVACPEISRFCVIGVADDNPAMRFASMLTTQDSADDAIGELLARGAAFDGDVSLASLFISGSLIKKTEAIVAAIRERIGPAVLVGCSAESVAGDGREIEQAAAAVLMLADMPGVEASPIRVAMDQWPTLTASHHQLFDALSINTQTQALIALADPWTTPIDFLLSASNEHLPGMPIVGGVASGARAPRQNRLILDDQVVDNGLVGVSLRGNLRVESFVSQGCKPLWKPLVITRGRGNAIEQLGGRPALEVLRELIESMDESEKSQLGHGLMLGRAVSEYRDQFGLGDFLIRAILGIEEENQVIGVADKIRVGQTIQFHVRDAQTAHDDLAAHLNAAGQNGAPAGAMLFTCNGRGSRMFDMPDHDIATLAAAFPDTPAAGFFAAGEIGPVDQRNFMHGHSASVALFRPG